MSTLAFNALSKKIDDTKREIEKLEDSKISLPGLKEAMLSQLNERLNDLAIEMEQLEKYSFKETLSLRIHGNDVERGKISSRLLINILHGFQSSIDSIAESIISASPSKGRIKESTLKTTDFQVVAFSPGSFEVVLEKETPDTLAETVTSIALSDVFSVIECGNNTDLLSEYVAPFGLKFAKHYKELLSELKSNSVDLEMNWIDHNAELQKYNIEHRNAVEIIDYLNTISDILEERVFLTGKLTMINIRSNRFEFESEERGLIKGRSRIEILMRAKQTIGNEIAAQFIKSDNYSSTGALSKTTWFLDSI